MKNCTASKEGYSTEEIWLGINENTVYDFVLSCVSFKSNANGPYFGWADQQVRFHGSAYCGSEPYTWHWDFGDGVTSDLQNPINIYEQPGNYTVELEVTDSTDGPNSTVNDTTWALIGVLPILPPPEIFGPRTAKVWVEQDYNFIIPNVTYCDDIRLMVDWGDTGPGKWGGPYDPGENVTLSYRWRKKEDYTIKARVMDVFGTVSDWASFDIIIPRTGASDYSFWSSFLERFPIIQEVFHVL
jgi:hypothetical protein